MVRRVENVEQAYRLLLNPDAVTERKADGYYVSILSVECFVQFGRGKTKEESVEMLTRNLRHFEKLIEEPVKH